MTYEAFAIDKYDFKPDDKLFIDTNIWMLIYGPQKPSDSKVNTYSQALAKILAAQSCIYIDVLIVSEFINTYARLRWNLWRDQSASSGNFKKFRKSKNFKPVAEEIAANVRRVLKHCTRVDSGFESLEIDTLIDEYATGDFDFNDQILANLCKKDGLMMVTDDGDFKSRGIPVITANKRLLV